MCWDFHPFLVWPICLRRAWLHWLLWSSTVNCMWWSTEFRCSRNPSLCDDWRMVTGVIHKSFPEIRRMRCWSNGLYLKALHVEVSQYGAEGRPHGRHCPTAQRFFLGSWSKYWWCRTPEDLGCFLLKVRFFAVVPGLVLTAVWWWWWLLLLTQMSIVPLHHMTSCIGLSPSRCP